jgi:signal transduction histidine kinase
MVRRIPIAKKLLVMVLTTSAVLSTVLTVAQIGFEYQEKRNQLKAVIAGIESSLLPSIAQRMWDFDVASLPDQFRGMMANVDLSHVKLESNKGKIIFDEGRPGFTAKYPIETVFPIEFTNQGDKTQVGTLTMVFFSDKIIEEIRFHFVTLLIFNMIKTLIVALVLIQLFKRTVTSPLINILSYFAQVDKLKLGDVRPILAVKRADLAEDEITDLIQFIRTHDQELFALQAEQQSKIETQEKILEENDTTIKQERVRAEMSARTAQLSQMASGIAHEINNPLAIISGYLQLSTREIGKSKPNLPSATEILHKADKTVMRISKIITGLRSYARDGRNDPMEMVNIAELMSDAADLISSRIASEGVTLKFVNHCAAAEQVFCRRVEVAQIIVALTNNSFLAVKGSPDSWITVEASCVSGHFKLLVIDSGKGIPANIASKIFDPFFTTREPGQGTGLGLSICHGFAQDHHGELTLKESAANTTFELLIPLLQNAA